MIGDVLRRWRTMRELSLKEAAEMTGLKYVTLSNLERGGRMDSETQLKLIRWLFERRQNGDRS